MKVSGNNESSYQLPPAGIHRAVLFQVCDLGIQETTWQGVTKHQHKVRFAWELTDELMDDGKPFSVSKQYTANLGSKANLRKDLESWRGRPFTNEELDGFDLQNVLGAPCMVNVVHNENNGKTYANVTAVTPLAKGMEKPVAHNPLLHFDLDNYTAEQESALPEWLHKMINFAIPNFAALDALEKEHQNQANTDLSNRPNYQDRRGDDFEQFAGKSSCEVPVDEFDDTDIPF